MRKRSLFSGLGGRFLGAMDTYSQRGTLWRRGFGAVALFLCLGLGVFLCRGESSTLETRNSIEQDLRQELLRSILVALARKDFPKAHASAQKALGLYPGDPYVLVLCGRVALAERKFDQAEVWLTQALHRKTGYLLAHRFLGDAYLGRKSLEKACRHYREYLRGAEGDPAVLVKLYYCELLRGNLGSVDRIGSQLDAFDQTEPAYYFAKAARAKIEGKESEAEHWLEQARVLYGEEQFARYLEDFQLAFAPAG
jgi:tetratricopeptide (TPR) repeat protein